MVGDAQKATQLGLALLELEDQHSCNAVILRQRALDIRRQARRIGDELLVMRARLCLAVARMRTGDLAGAASEVFDIHEWALAHPARQLSARTHVVWSTIHRHLGDHAQCLEHAVLAVELLDDDATAHMQVWHRAKLADALAQAGSMEAARARYAQAHDLAVALDQPQLLLALLNNHAYTELSVGDPARAQDVAHRLQAHAERYQYVLEPTVLDTLSAIAIENGRYAEAVATMQTCLSRYENGAYEDADALAEFHLTLARASRGLGSYAHAQASLDTSRALCVERQLGDVLVRLHQEQAELHAARGEYAVAFATHKLFFSAYHALHSAQREAQARTRQAMFETAEARQEAERFREQARRDPLTGLRNRRYLDEQLPALIAAGGELTVAIVDLDDFKRINDLLSHEVGDRVLVEVARLLETELAVIAPGGFVARLGGEEFLLVLPELPIDPAAQALDMLRQTLRTHDWAPLTGTIAVTVSIGVAGLTDAPVRTQSALLSIADRNLYVAKHAGRDRVIAGPGHDPRTRTYRDSAPAA